MTDLQYMIRAFEQINQRTTLIEYAGMKYLVVGRDVQLAAFIKDRHLYNYLTFNMEGKMR